MSVCAPLRVCRQSLNRAPVSCHNTWRYPCFEFSAYGRMYSLSDSISCTCARALMPLTRSPSHTACTCATLTLAPACLLSHSSQSLHLLSYLPLSLPKPLTQSHHAHAHNYHTHTRLSLTSHGPSASLSIPPTHPSSLPLHISPMPVPTPSHSHFVLAHCLRSRAFRCNLLLHLDSCRLCECACRPHTRCVSEPHIEHCLQRSPVSEHTAHPP